MIDLWAIVEEAAKEASSRPDNIVGAIVGFLRSASNAVDGAHLELPNGEMIYTGEWHALADALEESH